MNPQVVPGWLTFPLAGIAMLAIAAHLVAVERRGGERIRLRIRIANGWVMLLMVPLLAAGFSIVNANTRPRLFVIVWMTVLGLAGISICLALADMVNTSRIARRSRRELLQERIDLSRHAMEKLNQSSGAEDASNES